MAVQWKKAPGGANYGGLVGMHDAAYRHGPYLLVHHIIAGKFSLYKALGAKEWGACLSKQSKKKCEAWVEAEQTPADPLPVPPGGPTLRTKVLAALGMAEQLTTEGLAAELSALTRGHAMTPEGRRLAKAKAAILSGRLVECRNDTADVLLSLPKPGRRMLRKELAGIGRHDLAEIGTASWPFTTNK